MSDEKDSSSAGEEVRKPESEQDAPVEELPEDEESSEPDAPESDEDDEASESDEDEEISESDDDEEISESDEDEEEPSPEDDIWLGSNEPDGETEEEIDPELLALGEERSDPKWHRPIIMGVVCVLIIIMMVWFKNDMLYFFAPDDPLDLGEAHDIEFDESWENRYVRFSGMPLAPSVQNPDPVCGRLQGFPTYQRRFLCRGHNSAIPLMGRPEHDLLVQRYVVRKLRVFYTPPEGREAETLAAAKRAALSVGAVHKVEATREGQLGRLLVDIEGSPGRTSLKAVGKSVKFQIEASVPGVQRVRVERDRRDPPGSFEGRLVRIGDLGSRFKAVADFLNDCTNYEVDEDTWVVLDGSESGTSAFDSPGLCYGQSPRQYWPYLVLYVLLGAIFVLNIYLMFRFFRGLTKD